MDVLFHGSWSPYTPKKPLREAPRGTMYVKRDKDGLDWYDFVKRHNYPERNSVMFTCSFQHGVWIVGSASWDVTRLFPAMQSVFELIDYKNGTPEAELIGKIYDPDTKEFSKFSEDKLRM